MKVYPLFINISTRRVLPCHQYPIWPEFLTRIVYPISVMDPKFTDDQVSSHCRAEKLFRIEYFISIAVFLTLGCCHALQRSYQTFMPVCATLDVTLARLISPWQERNKKNNQTSLDFSIIGGI